MKGINTWAIRLERHSGPFLKWTREELQQMDERTRKLMTMHEALHHRDDIDRQEKKEDKDLPAFKIASMSWYNDIQTT